MPPDLLTAVTQFGVAGLIAWMWLTERRAAADRERQLTQAHDAILQERARLDAVLAALDANTRAVTALEVGQRELIQTLKPLPRAGDRSP